MRAKYYLAPAAAFFLIITFVTSPAITLEASARAGPVVNIVLPSFAFLSPLSPHWTGRSALSQGSPGASDATLVRVPGIGGFIFALGIASGSPMGAMLTARYRVWGPQQRRRKINVLCQLPGRCLLQEQLPQACWAGPSGVTLLLVHYLSAYLQGSSWVFTR